MSKYIDREFIIGLLATLLLIFGVIEQEVWSVLVIAIFTKMEVKRKIKNGRRGKK